MNRYRFLWTDDSGSHFRDVEANSFAHALWDLAVELGAGTLVDTMVLPSRQNGYGAPVHVELYPNWSKDE